MMRGFALSPSGTLPEVPDSELSLYVTEGGDFAEGRTDTRCSSPTSPRDQTHSSDSDPHSGVMAAACQRPRWPGSRR
jgi:hypothetical protein